MRALPALSLVLLAACGGPLELEGGLFGSLGFAPVGAVAAEGTAGLTLLALEAPLSCDEAPAAQPGKKSLVLQIVEPAGPGSYAVDAGEAKSFAIGDVCSLTAQPFAAEGGTITIESLDQERFVGSFDLLVEGEAAVGSFDVELCPQLPVGERECPDESDLPPPPDLPEGA